MLDDDDDVYDAHLFIYPPSHLLVCYIARTPANLSAYAVSLLLESNSSPWTVSLKEGVCDDWVVEMSGTVVAVKSRWWCLLLCHDNTA